MIGKDIYFFFEIPNNKRQTLLNKKYAPLETNSNGAQILLRKEIN